MKHGAWYAALRRESYPEREPRAFVMSDRERTHPRCHEQPSGVRRTDTPPSSVEAAMDRCDKCGCKASVTWLDEADRVFTFCGHHSRELADALERAGYVMVEDSLVPA